MLPADGPRTAALYAAIRKLIESGAVSPRSKLPTTRDLAKRLRLSRGSVVAAFEMLIADGFAEARVGAGTYVAAQVPLLTRSVEETNAPVKFPAPKPGALGVAVSDARTLTIFRRLLMRHLAQPGPEHFHYGDPRGGLVLREAIASYLRTARGVRCSAASVLVTAGTAQGLDLVIRAALQPGDAIWIEDPCYPMARDAFAGAGVRLMGAAVDAEGMTPAYGEKSAPRARAAYVTPSHQFPLGVTMSMARRLALIEWARRNRAWIIEDDYDSEFRYAGSPLTALQGIDDSGCVVYLGTFSKVLFPGLRVGYAVAPELLLEKMIAIRNRAIRHPPTLAEAALADLLREGHFAAHLRRARRRTQAARDDLVAGLSASGALDVTTPDQGLHLIAKAPPGMTDAEMMSIADSVGLGARALSSMYLSQAPQHGLVIGFSGFPGAEFRRVASDFSARLKQRGSRGKTRRK